MNRRTALYLALVAALFISASGTAAPAGCNLSPSWASHWAATVNMRIMSGVGCQTKVNTYGALVRPRRLEISQPPQHGSAGTIGFDYWTYQSHAGYVGPDSFQVRIWMKSKPFLLTLNVTVTP